MNYARVFTNIRQKTVAISRVAAPNLWKGAKRDRVLFARLWLADMSRIYDVPCPQFQYTDDAELRDVTGGGCFIPSLNRIELYTWSFVTLAHEFRHALQAAGVLVELYKGDPEEDARAWSISLFRLACPRSFARALADGKLHIGPLPASNNFVRAISPALDELSRRYRNP